MLRHTVGFRPGSGQSPAQYCCTWRCSVQCMHAGFKLSPQCTCDKDQMRRRKVRFLGNTQKSDSACRGILLARLPCWAAAWVASGQSVQLLGDVNCLSCTHDCRVFIFASWRSACGLPGVTGQTCWCSCLWGVLLGVVLSV
jgi:hypothetical protein